MQLINLSVPPPHHKHTHKSCESVFWNWWDR